MTARAPAPLDPPGLPARQSGANHQLSSFYCLQVCAATSLVVLAVREDQIALSSVSPVRTRTAWSIAETKILPSPIWPVLAARTMASTALSTVPDGTTTSIFTLGRKLTAYSAPR